MTETGPCKKCMKEIPLKAERCPECGWEPGKPVLGALGKIIGYIMMLGAIFQILAGVTVLFTPLVGTPITSAITGFILFAGAGSLQALIAAWLGGFGTKHAAEQPDETSYEAGEVADELRESWERGEDIGDRVRSRIDALPNIIFTSLIAAGTLLTFTMFAVVGAETEIADIPPEDLMILVMAVSMAVLGFTVMADIGRMNRVYGTDFKWWLWGVGAIIPIIGIIPALGWMWRRRSAPRDSSENADGAITPS